MFYASRASELECFELCLLNETDVTCSKSTWTGVTELCLLTETDVTCFKSRRAGVFWTLFINWNWCNMLSKADELELFELCLLTETDGTLLRKHLWSRVIWTLFLNWNWRNKVDKLESFELRLVTEKQFNVLQKPMIYSGLNCVY
jgi:hypothetical protein